jgi:hypothetical protein
LVGLITVLVNTVISLLACEPAFVLGSRSDMLRVRYVYASLATCQCLPESLKDKTFAAALKDDITVKRWLTRCAHVIKTQ